MKQQTAIDWLIKEIIDDQTKKSKSKKEWWVVFDQAKQMEKEQRIKDYNAGYSDAQCNHVNDAENYANEQDYLSSKD